jgi:hypothetical protein
MIKTTLKTLMLVAILSVGTPSHSSTAVEEHFPENSNTAEVLSPEYKATQALLNEIINSRFPEYVGMIPFQEEMRIELYIFGLPSQALLKLIEANEKVNVNLRQASYSLNELKKAQAEVTALFEVGDIPSDLVLKFNHKNDDGSGLTLTFKDELSESGLKWVGQLERDLEVHIDLEVNGDEFFLAGSRSADVPPWHGGALYNQTGYSPDEVCSTGFGVVSNTTNIQYLLTARHCFPSGTGLADEFLDAWGSGSLIASWQPQSYYNYPSHDLALVYPIGGNVSSYIYNGNYTTTNLTKVVSVAQNQLNTIVCVNGGNSGNHCNVKVISSPTVAYYTGVSYNDVVIAQRTNFTIVLAAGDSGSPVTSQGSTANTLFGNGIVLGGSNDQTPCSSFGTPTHVPAKCFRTVFFTDLSSDLAVSHMRLK